MTNKHFYFFIALMMFLGVSNKPLSAQTERQGDLVDLIEAIRERMPGWDSNRFIKPTLAQQDSFGLVIDAMLNEQYTRADSLATLFDYTLYAYSDQAHDNRLHYVLMENGADQSTGPKRGWGTYVLYPRGKTDVLVEVPHPYWDSNTWLVGFSAYQLLQSSFFIMAGTHRYANGQNPAPADVAHNEDNIFHTVHQRWAPLSKHALQIHGYSRSTRPEYASYPDVVLSNGTTSPSEILDSLDQAIESEGYSSGIFDGTLYGYLGATTNKQGIWSNNRGHSFVHMELEYFIRNSRSEWENILDALRLTFFTETGLTASTGPELPQTVLLADNYPNPFNPITIIPFSINQRQNIYLAIYSVTGKIVRQLIETELNPGFYTIEWDGCNDLGRPVSSGIYYYRLKTNRTDQCKTMLLIR